MASLQDQKPWKVEYAKSSKSSCKTCKTPIDKKKLRLGKLVQATQFDGFIPMWNHAECILKKAKQFKSTGDVEGFELIRWEDQQKIRKYVERPQQAETNAVTGMECGVEVSQTSRAACRLCSEKILKGEVRISTKPEGHGARSLAWHHAKCYLESSPSIQLEELTGWKTLAPSDQATVHALVKKAPSTTKSETKVEEQDDNELKQSTSKAGAKRKKDVGGDQKSKVAKADGDVSKSRGASARNNS